MANMNDLKLRVEKAEDKVQKCNKTIEKHQKQLAKKEKVLIDMGYDISNLEAIKRNEDGTGSELYWEVVEVERKHEDIKNANKKLADAERVLNNWQEKVDMELEKERFLNDEAPQAIKDFLAMWKEKVYKWHVKRYEDYQTFKEELNNDMYNTMVEVIKSNPEQYEVYLDENGEIKDYYDSISGLLNAYPREPIENALVEKNLDYKSIKGRKLMFGGQAILRMDTIRSEEERLQWLETMLEEDRKAKMLDLINRINKVVGNILDASDLSISVEGNLNGIITGEKGKAKIETIGAGGYNIQCFHFRTIVNKVKNPA